MQIEYNCTSNQHYDQSNWQMCLQFLQTVKISLRIDIALFQLKIHSNTI